MKWLMLMVLPWALVGCVQTRATTEVLVRGSPCALGCRGVAGYPLAKSGGVGLGGCTGADVGFAAEYPRGFGEGWT